MSNLSEVKTVFTVDLTAFVDGLKTMLSMTASTGAQLKPLLTVDAKMPNYSGLETQLKGLADRTKEYLKAQQDTTAVTGAAAVITGVATSAVAKHEKQTSSMMEWYRRERSEKRLHTFMYREGTEVMMAASMVLALWGNTAGSTSEKNKKLTDSLNAGFVGFQGISMALSMLPFGLGLVAGAAAGLAIIYSKLTGNTEEVAAAQKIYNGILNDSFSGVNKNELEKELDFFKRLKISKQEDVYVAQAQLNAMQDIESRKEETLEQYNKEFASRERDLQQAESALRANEQYIKAAQDKLEVLKQTEIEEQRRSGGVIAEGNTTAALTEKIKKQEEALTHLTIGSQAYIKKQEEINKLNNDLANAKAFGTSEITIGMKLFMGGQVYDTLNSIKSQLMAFGKETDKMFGGAPQGSESAVVKAYEERASAIEEINKQITSNRIRAIADDKTREFAAINEWENKILDSTVATEAQKTEATKIAAEMRKNITIEEEKKKNEEILNGIVQTVGYIAQAAQTMLNIQTDKTSKVIGAEKKQREAALEAEKKEALSHAKTAKEREKIEVQYAKKKEALDAEMNEKAKEQNADSFAAWKALAIIKATVDTYTAANAAYAALAGIPIVGPVLAGIAAGAAVIAGLANVAAIAGQEVPGYAQGGELPKGQRGYIEGIHDEVIAPKKALLPTLREILLPEINKETLAAPSYLRRQEMRDAAVEMVKAQIEVSNQAGASAGGLNNKTEIHFHFSPQNYYGDEQHFEKVLKPKIEQAMIKQGASSVTELFANRRKNTNA